jgi:class 3 adenylate cyclase
MNRSASHRRRLSAILVADVVGFTRMMEQDDTGTFERRATRSSTG